MDLPAVFTGTVITGNRLGRTIGFPTINLPMEESRLGSLKKGVYAARVLYNRKCYDGMAYLGIRPTVEDHRLLLEVNLFDFTEEIYGKIITVYLFDYIREERKFSGLDEMKIQISRDKEIISEILKMRAHPDPDSQ